jgi:hypothetical protein
MLKSINFLGILDNSSILVSCFWFLVLGFSSWPVFCFWFPVVHAGRNRKPPTKTDNKNLKLNNVKPKTDTAIATISQHMAPVLRAQALLRRRDPTI